MSNVVLRHGFVIAFEEAGHSPKMCETTSLIAGTYKNLADRPGEAYFQAGAVFFLLIFMTLCSVVNHAGWEMFPKSFTDGIFGKIFISACHHNVHHKDYNANYGLYFRFWDDWMGTDKGLAQPIASAAD